MLILYEVLKDIYLSVHDMVRFSETKNALLIAFNSAVTVGMIKLIYDLKNEIIFVIYFSYVLAMSLVSLFISFSAVIPQVKHKERDLKLNKSDNLLFFGTIAHLEPKEYLEKVKSKYQLESINDSYEYDLARQIVISSQIAARKYQLFNRATLWTLGGILTPLSIIIYKIFYDPNRF